MVCNSKENKSFHVIFLRPKYTVSKSNRNQSFLLTIVSQADLLQIKYMHLFTVVELSTGTPHNKFLYEQKMGTNTEVE